MNGSPEGLESDAVNWALLSGLLKYNDKGQVSHAPFVLDPYAIAAPLTALLCSLTPLCNELSLRVAADHEFLEEVLAPASRADEFTRYLLNLARDSAGSQPLRLLITRSDYFLTRLGNDGPLQARQVEMNTISASYAGLSGVMQGLHARLSAAHSPPRHLLANDPIAGIADGISQAMRLYGDQQACLLMVVDPDEPNVFDQLLLEGALLARGVPTKRVSLENIGSFGSIREGQLVLDGQAAAVTYFRSGYAPWQLKHPNARQGRELIAHSDTIAVPDTAVQLAGTKKVQQLLTQHEVLNRFANPEAARDLAGSFAAMFDLEQPLAEQPGQPPAWCHAVEHPAGYVLKPQREGGGNNLYDGEIPATLRHASKQDRSAYVLMERLYPITHRARLVKEARGATQECVSELGRFGVLLADNRRILENRDVGYLVRTKPAAVNEGGVSAGFGYLNSLAIEPD